MVAKGFAGFPALQTCMNWLWNTEGPRERARHHWGLALALSDFPRG
jgi:hypothetical protein